MLKMSQLLSFRMFLIYFHNQEQIMSFAFSQKDVTKDATDAGIKKMPY